MISTIIVAGGQSRRMGGQVLKQFIEIGGLPILMRVIKNFDYLSGEIIVVLHPQWLAYWEDLCMKYNFSVPHKIAQAGAERFESVANGLCEVGSDSELILVQDGVRPFVSREMIDRVVRQALLGGAAVPVVELTDTLRAKNGEQLDRGEILAMQTPQGFAADVLRSAYQRENYNARFTDDASVVQAMGHAIDFVEGDRENIKITTPFDLKIAEILWQKY